MPPNNSTVEKIVTEWLHKAEEDFKSAACLLKHNDGMTNAIAFHAQQSAEKFLKAYLTSKQITFPKTHDLQRLLELAGTTNEQLADELGDVIILTPFGVEIRCPGDRPDATQEEAEMAVTLLSRVRDAVLEALRH